MATPRTQPLDDPRHELIRKLEGRFRHLSLVLYDTTVPPSVVDEEVRPYLDEEMWSFGDMLAALPLIGPLYKNGFRRGFSYAFLGASYLSCRLRRMLPRTVSP